MPSFVDVITGALAKASDVQQIIDALKGTAGKGIPLSLTSVNDAINFALSVKNNDATASKTAVFYKADGTVLFQIDKNGVIASADGTTSASQIPTLTGAQTLTNKTLTAPHMTGPVVDSGGLTITAGNVGIGGAPTTNSVVRITGSVTSGSTTEVGVNSSFTSSTGATTEVSGFYANPATAASVFTVTTVAGFHALNPSKGATSIITSAYGLLVDGIGAGNTNNYGVFISAPSGGSGVNYGLYNAGTSRFDGGLGFGIVPLASTAITVSGTLLPARTAGNVYVVWDTATGAFKQSAIGPAS